MKAFLESIRESHQIGVEIEKLGQIELHGTAMVSDPCYPVGTWCQSEVNVSDGVYDAFVVRERDGKTIAGRPLELIVVKQGVDGPDLFSDETLFEIGVDSGQAGIFDSAYYTSSQEKKTWYDQVCSITLDREKCSGTIDGRGAVSESGYGDGSYICHPAFDEETDEIVGLRLVFIED